ncbi:MAG: glycosyltransferase family 1 protein [Pseudomonadota bacterium]
MIATDAWYPQVNGVVRTLDNVTRNLRELGHEVKIVSHEGKKTWGLPSYPEIQIAFFSQKEIAKLVKEFDPHSIHIATEGPIGFAMRKYCLKNGLKFTTGFHTRFAEYAQARIPFPGVESFAYSILRWFHKPSSAVLAPTTSVTRSLEARNFNNVVTWTRGVDHENFQDYGEKPPKDFEHPVMVYVGRLAVEKGIDDFLQLKHPGTKLVIGDGPSRPALEKKYPDVVFTGYLFGEELARKISSGNVFVFPSKTDTFGLVMLEAMACGLPVAAYPVTGPIDVVEHGYSGWLDDDLEVAVAKAVKLKRKDAIEYAARFTWMNTAIMFFENLHDIYSDQTEKPLQNETSR